MILQPYHFQTPERPKEEDYIFGIGDKPRKLVIDPQFQDDLSEWESLYGEEPQPEWISFEVKEPEQDSVIYFSKYNKQIINAIVYTKDRAYQRTEEIKYWCNANEFDTIHKRWKDHQVRYKGWTLSALSVNHPTFYNKSGGEVYFRNDKISIILPHSEHHFDFIPSADLFELILKENGIEL